MNKTAYEEVVQQALVENKKQDAGKLRYDLVPFEALDEVVKVLTFGAQKYGPHNWRAAVEGNVERYEAALLRHISAHMQGERVDPETNISHMAHAACNALFILTLQKDGK